MKNKTTINTKLRVKSGGGYSLRSCAAVFYFVEWYKAFPCYFLFSFLGSPYVYLFDCQSGYGLAPPPLLYDHPLYTKLIISIIKVDTLAGCLYNFEKSNLWKLNLLRWFIIVIPSGSHVVGCIKYKQHQAWQGSQAIWNLSKHSKHRNVNI